jgi:Ribbon-helix-helix protein, copG family
MPNFRIRGPKQIMPVRLGVKQIADLDRYAEVSGMSRDELIRRAVALFFEELRDDEDFPGREPRDSGCRSAALPPAYRFPLPPGCGERGE